MLLLSGSYGWVKLREALRQSAEGAEYNSHGRAHQSAKGAKDKARGKREPSNNQSADGAKIRARASANQSANGAEYNSQGQARAKRARRPWLAINKEGAKA